ncbi:hypothetical protein F511_09219 [Dorcoceras hygrometricum]|uniref:Uncharacterized protein n=1 Tax=Dorcoceras hygrometricum TaxID=472368 RepID=A0A2Z7CPU4_9LAMI|nr:hypothetical protein F511_09219 [Dorcoceras hygrometricum]
MQIKVQFPPKQGIIRPGSWAPSRIRRSRRLRFSTADRISEKLKHSSPSYTGGREDDVVSANIDSASSHPDDRTVAAAQRKSRAILEKPEACMTATFSGVLEAAAWNR